MSASVRSHSIAHTEWVRLGKLSSDLICSKSVKWARQWRALPGRLFWVIIAWQTKGCLPAQQVGKWVSRIFTLKKTQTAQYTDSLFSPFGIFWDGFQLFALNKMTLYCRGHIEALLFRVVVPTPPQRQTKERASPLETDEPQTTQSAPMP